MGVTSSGPVLPHAATWATDTPLQHLAQPASELTALAARQRRQLAVLGATGVTASLYQEVESGTWLASLRPVREELPARPKGVLVVLC